MRKFISQSYRRGMLIFIGIILILGINGVDMVKKIQSIDKTQITIYAEENLRDGFETVKKFSKASWYYDMSYSDDIKNSQIVLTSDIEKIDKSKKYEIVAHSPLVLMMNESVKLNDLLVSYNEKGFLISDSKIKNTASDKINCDFTKVVEAINAGGDWSNLGGDEIQEIVIYCPKLETDQGKLFKEFLVRSYNNGLNETNEEIEKKIEMFFESENVIQTDIYHKLQLLKNNIPENVIFVGFEHDLLNFYSNYSQNFTFIYPQKTILEYIYVQINSEDEKINEKFFESWWILKNKDIYNIFCEDYYYRLGETGKTPTLSYYSNVQAGIDTFEN